VSVRETLMIDTCIQRRALEKVWWAGRVGRMPVQETEPAWVLF